MLQPIRTAIEGKFRSLDGLAKALKDRHPELEWPSYRSLGTKIGAIDRGDDTWWQRRLGHAMALASLLEVDPAELGLHPKGGKLFHFADFPELPPVDPTRETFCRLGEAVSSSGERDDEFGLWFGTQRTSVRREPITTSWLHVPPGTGRSLLLAELEGARRFDVMEVSSLADALPRLRKAEPVVIGIQTDGGLEDLNALSQRPDDTGLLIIAPFSAPARETAQIAEFHSWEYVTANKTDRRILDLTNPNGIGSKIHSYIWRLKHDWQEILLAWVEARLTKHGIDTTFTAKGLRTWLDKFDSHREWIRSPEDLIAICRVSHKIRETRLPKFSDSRAGKQLLKAVMAPKPHNEASFTRLSIKRWNSLPLPWRAAIPFEAWQSLNSGSAPLIGKAELVAIADAPNQKARREQAHRVAEQMASADIRSMIDDQLLVKDARGHYELKPRSLADLVVRDHLMEQVVGAPLDAWALASFDPARREVIDAVLDAMSSDNLLAIVNRLPDAPEWGAAETAAAEALFYAVGRRILSDYDVPEALLAIGPRTLSKIDLEDSPYISHPWSRAITTEDEELEWRAVCWAWSLTSKPVAAPVSNYPSWLFPGWSNGLLEPEYWPPDLSRVEHMEACPPSWNSLLRAADRLVAKRETTILQAPLFMHSSLLAASAAGVRPAKEDWWEGVLGYHWAEDRLLAQLARHGASAAAQLWPSLVRYEATRTVQIDLVCARFSRVRSWILQQLSAKEVLSPLSDEEQLFLSNDLTSLPPAVRVALLETMPVETMEREFSRARAFFRSCSTESILCLVRWLETGVSSLAAETIWEQAPDTALKWIRENGMEKKSSLEKLIWACPGDYVGQAAQLLLDNSSLLAPVQRRAWAKFRLPSSGAAAQKLFEVMRA